MKITNREHWLKEQSDKFPSKVFLIDGNNQATFSQILKSTYTVFSTLKKIGIKKNNRVGILCENNIEFIKLVNALWFIGAVPVPLNIRNTSAEIEESLQSIGAKYLLIHSNLKHKYLSIEKISVFYFPLKFRLEKSITLKNRFNIDNDSLILFTSASIQKPKAVLHSFSNLYQSTLLTDQISGLNENDVWLASLPFYHIGGFMIFVRALLSGATILFPKSFSADDISFEMKKNNPTHISLVPTVLKRLVDLKVKCNKNLKQLYLGGGPISKTIAERAIRNNYPIVKVYGSTETCSMICALPYEKYNSKPNSVGKPLGNTKIKIVDRNRFSIGKNKIGEIAIRSKSNFLNYIKNSKLTRNVKHKKYYLSGDFGFIDNDGFLYIESRREDLIISGGENINPKDIETELLKMTGINDAFVFSLADSAWGQIVCAAIVTSKKMDEKKIENYLKRKIASYKIPKKIFFVKTIPRNEMGKVLRKKLITTIS